MARFRRYALYVLAPEPMHTRGSAWLGWDSKAGTFVDHPHIEGLPKAVEELTLAPRKYGFHGTIKAPFRLANGYSEADLCAACEDTLKSVVSVSIPEMSIRAFKGFVAAVPAEPSGNLQAMAAEVVSQLDDFRAPLSDDDLARRRKSALSKRQDSLLQRWGYPFVMDEFKFHMTLSGRLSEPDADQLEQVLSRHFQPINPIPFGINSLALAGEAEGGFFHVIDAYPLAGAVL